MILYKYLSVSIVWKRSMGDPSLLGPTRGEKAEKLVKLLDGLGFQASLKKSDNAFVFTSSNCPLLKTAEAHQEIVCRGFHEELIKRYLGAKHVKRETWIVDGDPYCVHKIPAQ